MDAPSPESVRETLASFDTRQQKIVAGLFAVMVQNASQVRDREWIARQLAEITVMAGGFETESPDVALETIQTFLRENSEKLLNGAYLLFQRVGLDLQPRADEGFTFEDAMTLGLGYLPSVGGAED